MRKVLLIEDNVANRSGLSRLLRLHDLSTVETGTLKAGLAALDDGAVDCAVLDLNLPDSGPEETVAAIERFGDVPVLAYTGIDDAELVDKALQAGAYSVITKGSPADAMVPTILKAMLDGDRAGDVVGKSGWRARGEHYPVAGNGLVKKITTGKLLFGAIVLFATQTAGLVTWIYHEGGTRAIEQQQLTENTAALKTALPAIAHLEEKSAQHDAAIASVNDRVTKQWDAMNALRADMNAHFDRLSDQNTKIMQMMIEQRQPNR